MAEKNYGKAKDSFKQALSGDERNLVARIGLGNVYLREKDGTAAEEEFSLAIEIAPQYSFSYSDRSRARIMNNDPIGALEDLSKAISLDPDFYWYYIDRGKLLLAVFAEEEAAKNDYDRAIGLDPEYFLPYVYRAGILEQQGKLKEAAADYRMVVKLNPDYYYAYEPLGLILYREKEWEEAVPYLQKAYERNREAYWFPLLITLSLQRGGKDQQAKAYIEKGIAALPRNSLYFHMARMLLEPGYDNLALREIDAERDVYLKTQMLYYLGTHYLVQKKPNLALRYFMEVADKNLGSLFETELARWELSELRRK